MATLHYIFDPLCGWCYGAAPLVKAAQTIPGLTIALHAGGMMTGNRRRTISDEWRDYVMPHDKRIAELTGQPFGENYFNGLLCDPTAVMDSEPPITAILAVEQLAGRGVDMLHHIQEAHYRDGKRITDKLVLAALAEKLGLDTSAFTAKMQFNRGAPTTQHIAESRALLGKIHGQGFPTFALQDNQDQWLPILLDGYWRNVDGWKAQLKNMMN